MMTIQRPGEATAELLWCAPGGPFPINAQLVVGAEECIVASLNGVVLGVIPPGSHWLHPQPFPFLANAVAGGTQLGVELWFVTTSTYAGVKFGGPLGSMLDSAAEVEIAPRVIGDYALVVENPAALVAACMGQGGSSASPILGWVTGILLKHVKELVAALVMSEGFLAMSRKVATRAATDLPAAMGEIGAVGLAFREVHAINVSVSEEDRAALTAAADAKAAAKRAAAQPSLACGRCHTVHAGGRFCTACGQALPA